MTNITARAGRLLDVRVVPAHPAARADARALRLRLRCVGHRRRPADAAEHARDAGRRAVRRAAGDPLRLAAAARDRDRRSARSRSSSTRSRTRPNGRSRSAARCSASASGSASPRWRTSSSSRCRSDEVGVATGINTIMRTLGGALGAQLVASLLTGKTIAGTPIPAEAAYTDAFIVAAIAAVLAMLCALVDPAQAPAAAEGRHGASASVTARSACSRVVSNTGTGESSGPTSRSISVQPSRMPWAPADGQRAHDPPVLVARGVAHDPDAQLLVDDVVDDLAVGRARARARRARARSAAARRRSPAPSCSRWRAGRRAPAPPRAPRRRWCRRCGRTGS